MVPVCVDRTGDKAVRIRAFGQGCFCGVGSEDGALGLSLGIVWLGTSVCPRQHCPCSGMEAELREVPGGCCLPSC